MCRSLSRMRLRMCSVSSAFDPRMLASSGCGCEGHGEQAGRGERSGSIRIVEVTRPRRLSVREGQSKVGRGPGRREWRKQGRMREENR